MLLGATAIVVVGLAREESSAAPADGDAPSPFAEIWSLLKGDRALVRFVLANALLTLGFSGLKSFVVLWLTLGLGRTMTFTAAAMSVVAFGSVVGALISGRLGDRFGARRVLSVALFIFGVGFSAPVFTTSVLLLAIVFPVIALSGGAALALPYAVLLEISPSKKHGIVAGLFDASSGLGTLLGPTLAGVSIDVLRGYFPASHGYAAMWPVLSIAVVASALLLARGSARGQAKTADPSGAGA